MPQGDVGSERRAGRRLGSLLAGALVVGAALAPPARAGDAQPCQVADLTLGTHHASGAGRALRLALAQAAPGDVIELRGRCVGSFAIARDVVLVGRPTRALASPVLQGTGAAPVLVVRAPHVELRGLRVEGTGAPSLVASGIVNRGGLRLVRATVRGNAAERGGGIRNEGALVLVRSTVSGNVAVDGAGVYSIGTLSLRTSTISGNVAAGDGGGIHSSGRLLVIGSTVAGNDAAFTGGGLFLARSGVVAASVLAANRAGASGPDCAGEATSLGWNVVFTTDGFFCAISPAVGDRIGPAGVEPGLGGLGWNGGPTATMLPAPASSAVDAIPAGARATDGTPLCPVQGSADQRGAPRPIGSGCDAGAVELGT